MIKIIFKAIKLAFKQLFCKHRYKYIGKFYGHHREQNKDIVFDYDYECIKCGKKLIVVMDEESQLEI